MIVLLDAGHGEDLHGRQDPGAVGFDKQESDYTEQVAVITANCLLKIFGVQTHITRAGHSNALHRKDHNPKDTPKWRIKDADNVKADVFVSIHWNAFPLPVYGTEVLITKDNKENRRLATEILAKLMGGLNHYDRVKQISDWTPKLRGIKKKGLGVLRQSIPCCLVECEFITHPTVNVLMDDRDFIWTIGYSIAYGIASYLGVTEDINLAHKK